MCPHAARRGSQAAPDGNAKWLFITEEHAAAVTCVTAGRATAEVSEGGPRRVLIDVAREWGADSIFVGSRGLDHPDETSGLGVVSAALATNAPCSVEVVR